MKKMITLGFIACSSLTSSTTFGMLVQRLHNNTKKITVPQKQYTDPCTEIIFLKQIITNLEQQNSLLKQEIATTELNNKKLDAHIKNMPETPRRLREMEYPSVELKPQQDMTKYQQDMNRYHSSKQSPE